MFKTVAVVVAAGQGSRMGTKINKQYLHLSGRPVLAHTLDVLEKHPLIDGIIIVTKADEINICYNEVVNPYQFKKVITIVAGGQERQDSVYQGLQALPSQCELVVVHDGARPLIMQDLVSEIIAIAWEEGAALIAVPVKDTIKRAVGGYVQETLPRSELWSVQTPQVFQKDLLLKAYEQALKEGIYGTDDASLVEMLGRKVKIVSGNYENIKITTPEDLEMAKIILARRGGIVGE